MTKGENKLSFKRIGIIGGGQLGKMMVSEGKKLGLFFAILDPLHDCPASSMVDKHIVADFYNKEEIRRLAEITDVITYEFEHIDADILMELEEEGYKIFPSPATLKIIQNKLHQKVFLRQQGIPVPDFQKIETLEELQDAVKSNGLPLLLKSCRGGYDGKGNFLIKTSEDISGAFEALGGKGSELMMEAYVPFVKEVSVIVARGANGEIKTYPLGENIHENNILKTTIVPARVTKEIKEKAKALAFKTMEVLKGIGIFCIEMFVDEDNNLLVNEIAPRTHNSGHYTIEACSTSQFSQHLRAIMELPLGSTSLVSPAVMINLLGEGGYEGKSKLIGLEKALELPEVYVHFYGKTDTKPERKMGHVTILGDSLQLALDKANKLTDMIKVVVEE